jgi:hypothetical protein
MHDREKNLPARTLSDDVDCLDAKFFAEKVEELRRLIQNPDDQSNGLSCGTDQDRFRN